MKRAAGEFSRGLLCWAHGWRYIMTQPRLLMLSAVPFFLGLVGSVVVLNFAWAIIPFGINGLLVFFHLNEGWVHDLLYYPLMVGAGLLYFVLGIFAVYVLTSLIAVPFYALLADRTLARLHKKPVQLSWRVALGLLAKGLVKTGVFLLVGLVLFVFSFLPILNVAAAAATMLLLAFDTMDYAFEGMGWGFRRRFKYVVREWPQWFGVAAGLALTLLVPGLTLLVIPGAVVGGALIVKSENPQ